MNELTIDEQSINERTINERTNLDFSDKEWESLKRLREADGAEMSKAPLQMIMATVVGHWGQGTRQPGALLMRERCKR